MRQIRYVAEAVGLSTGRVELRAQELKLRSANAAPISITATTSARSTPTHKPGFPGAEGAIRALVRALRLCRSSRPRLERGGRRGTASHQSRHRTLPRPPAGLTAKPQQSSTIRTASHTRLRSATGIRSGGRTAAPTVPAACRSAAGGGGMASVKAGVCAGGHGYLSKSRREIRSNSGLGRSFRLLSQRFRRAPVG